MNQAVSTFTLHEASSAEELNRHCFCRTLNHDRLYQQLERDPRLHHVMANITQTHPHLFSSSMLYANKHNLITLSSDQLLKEWGVADPDRNILNACIPKTQLVLKAKADELWNQRKQLFFKPARGYGAKATYRGDKLTKRVWAQILQEDFVAQELVPPSERLIEVDGQLNDLKFDIRAYTYAGKIQLMAARMYSGQTTNFRTDGGGFAPVFVVPTQKTP
jgi:hypothetical protein